MMGLTLALMVGCSQLSSVEVQVTNAQVALPSSTPTQLPSLSPIPSVTAASKEIFDCPDVGPSFTFSENTQGVLALEGIHPGTSLSILKMNTGENVILAEDIQDSALSPDHHFFAFHSAGKIKIITGDGQTAKSLPWDNSWRGIASWITQDNLLISRKGKIVNEIEAIDTMVDIDPWTGKVNFLLSNFPNVYQIYPFPHWDGYSASQIFYTPTLDKVIYIPLSEKGQPEMVLWDLQNQKELASWQAIVPYVYSPKWSPAGNKFVINVQSEITTLDNGLDQVKQDLFLISNDGNSTKLTDFSSTYADTLIGNYNWSPDGRFIAFSVRLSPVEYPKDYSNLHSIADDPNRLAILDTTTGNVTNYCIPDGSGLYAPIWSPDGNFLVITDDYYHGFPSKSLVLIFDIKNKVASILSQDSIPMGWLK